MVLSTSDRRMFINGEPKPERPRVPATTRAGATLPKRTSSSVAAAKKKPAPPPPEPPEFDASWPKMPSEMSPAEKPTEPLRERDDHRTTRDWAIMSRFEREVHARQEAEVKEEKRRATIEQKAYLDSQIEIQRLRVEKAREEKKRLAEAVAADVAKYKQEELVKERRRRAFEAEVKAEQDRMMAELEEKRRAAVAAKKAEEDRALREIQEQLESEAMAKAKKIEDAKTAYARTMRFNEEQKLIKLAEQKRVAEEELRVAAQYDEMLEAQERAREQAMADFHARIAARAGKAGEKVAEQSAAKEAEEHARMLKFHEEREDAMRAKERAAKAKKADATAEQLEMLSLQLDLQREEKEKIKADAMKYAEEMKEREAKLKAEDEEKKTARRRAAVMNRLELERQMTEKLDRRIAEHDDNMNEEELRFNSAILDQAKAVVLEREEF